MGLRNLHTTVVNVLSCVHTLAVVLPVYLLLPVPAATYCVRDHVLSAAVLLLLTVVPKMSKAWSMPRNTLAGNP